MKKTALAAAVAIAVGTSAAQANTAGLTGVWTGSYLFTMTSPNGGPVGGSGVNQAWTWDFDAGTIAINNTTTFYASVWTAKSVVVNDTGSDYTGSMLFDWSVNTNIPVIQTWDVSASGNAVGDTATALSLTGLIITPSPAFPGFQPQFSGPLTKVSGAVVPVPAAVWLMGSGLLGLVGVARRRRRG